MTSRLNHHLLILVFLFQYSHQVVGQSYLRPPAFAKKVYDDIFVCMDDNRTDKPTLYLSDNPKEIATRIPSDTYGNSVIVIGKGLIDICRNFGKDSMNALAHVLGHELAHVFKHQNDISMVGNGYASVDLKKQLKKFNDSLNFHVIERQADEYAAFYCHVAGYRTVHVGEAVLDSIYKRFNLTDAKLKKYPSLEERKLIVKNSEEQMKALKLMFDEGVLSLVAGNYKGAQEFFKTILKYQFNSREMYNNLGVAYLMEALQELDTLEFPYLFPLQIDIQSKLDRVTERSITDDTREKLEQALRQFKIATLNAKDYSIGFINKAIVEFLLEDYDEMKLSLDKAEKTGDSYTEFSASILRAIHLHKGGKKDEALQVLSCIAFKSELARRNYGIMEGKETELKSKSINDWSEILSLEWPNPVYSKEQIAEGRRAIEKLGENSGVSLRLWTSDEFQSRRWGFKKTIVDIQSKKEAIVIDELKWETLKKSADIFYEFGDSEFIVKGSLILKRKFESINIYRIK